MDHFKGHTMLSERPGCLYVVGTKGSAGTCKPRKPVTNFSDPAGKCNCRPSNEFIFAGQQFPTFESAEDFGRRLKISLAIFLAREGVGINLGKDQATSRAHRPIKEIGEKYGFQIRDDVHGLDVFCEQPTVKILSVKGALIGSSRAIPKYEEGVKALLENTPDLSEAQMLALELYNLTYFGLTPRARFLALVTVVEVLSEPESKSDRALALIRRFQSSVQSSVISVQEKKELRDGLGRLKTDSIGVSCTKLIAQLLSKAEAGYFNSCYKARSDLLHRGDTKRKEPQSPDKLDNIVRKLLLAHIGRITS